MADKKCEKVHNSNLMKFSIERLLAPNRKINQDEDKIIIGKNLYRFHERLHHIKT